MTPWEVLADVTYLDGGVYPLGIQVTSTDGSSFTDANTSFSVNYLTDTTTPTTYSVQEERAGPGRAGLFTDRHPATASSSSATVNQLGASPTTTGRVPADHRGDPRHVDFRGALRLGDLHRVRQLPDHLAFTAH